MDENKKDMIKEFSKLKTVSIGKRNGRLSALAWRSTTVNILSEDRMNEELIRLWNEKVPEDGVVFHAGDFWIHWRYRQD